MAHSSEFDLNRLVIPTPCTRDWGEMSGDQRKRYCSHCQKNVYNLASLSRSEIVDLIEGSGERICGRLYRRSDGTVVTSDCNNQVAPEVRKSKLRFTIAHVLALMTMSAAAFASIPWLGRKIEPIVHRWFAAPAPAPPVPFDDWVDGEIMMMPEDYNVDDPFGVEFKDTSDMPL